MQDFLGVTSCPWWFKLFTECVEALAFPAFKLPLQAGSSAHLRNAGTTSACSRLGSLKFESVSSIRLTPALYPVF